MIRAWTSVISLVVVVLALAAPVACTATPAGGAQATNAGGPSPDARDAASGRPPGDSTVVEIVRVPARPDGFDWGDALIGAGTVLGVTLVGLGAAGVVSRRRRHASRPAVA